MASTFPKLLVCLSLFLCVSALESSNPIRKLQKECYKKGFLYYRDEYFRLRDAAGGKELDDATKEAIGRKEGELVLKCIEEGEEKLNKGQKNPTAVRARRHAAE